MDALACALAALAPMLLLGSMPPRRLSEEDLVHARFRAGGTEMYFSDGRPPTRELAVTARSIADVIS